MGRGDEGGEEDGHTKTRRREGGGERKEEERGRGGERKGRGGEGRGRGGEGRGEERGLAGLRGAAWGVGMREGKRMGTRRHEDAKGEGGGKREGGLIGLGGRGQEPLGDLGHEESSQAANQMRGDA